LLVGYAHVVVAVVTLLIIYAVWRWRTLRIEGSKQKVDGGDKAKKT